LGLDWFQGAPFTGVFDADGHTISHLTIKGGSYLGLFGQLDCGAMISNLGLEAVDVNGIGFCIGGLVGINSGSITTCYSTGAVSGYERVGGLVGVVIGSVSNCYSTGTVMGHFGVGGLEGGNGGSITTSYSTGMVSGETSVGGLVRSADRDSDIIDCFWDTQTSGQTRNDGGTGLATAEMQTAGTFLEAGWDFVGETENGTEDLWWILEGQDYPRLWWELIEEEPG